MNPWLLIAMLERSDPSFKDLFYPGRFRCSLEDRVVRAIEEHWPAYFPTRKECRGTNWSLTISKNEPLYQPRAESRKKLADWKESIRGTIAEIRAYQADISWKRFLEICHQAPRIVRLLGDFKKLADFLIHEESLWPQYGGVAVGQDEYLRGQMQALFAPGSPYHHADPARLKFLDSQKKPMDKIRTIGLMRELFDRPLMVLAVLQQCVSESEHARCWLPIQNHISAILNNPSVAAIRRTWFEYAMQASGAIKKTGKSAPRKWARMLVQKKDPDLSLTNAKAVEVHYWLKGKKQPSMENVRLAGRVVMAAHKRTGSQAEIEKDLWLFSWMVTLWLEKHFTEIAAEFKTDRRKIRSYYSRFFRYLEISPLAKKMADGPHARRRFDNA